MKSMYGISSKNDSLKAITFKSQNYSVKFLDWNKILDLVPNFSLELKFFAMNLNPISEH